MTTRTSALVAGLVVAALPWGMQDDMLIMHAPVGKKGQPGVFCVS